MFGEKIPSTWFTDIVFNVYGISGIFNIEFNAVLISSMKMRYSKHLSQRIVGTIRHGKT